MQSGSWHFQATFWPGIATLLIFSFLLSLGFWQLDRAAQKEQIDQKFRANHKIPPILLNADKTLQQEQDLQWRNVIISGNFESAHQFLLDNQPMNFQTGYFVYTPFKLENDTTRILVNRGWVPANLDRQILPDIRLSEQTLTITGVATAPPTPGVVLSDNLTEFMKDGLIRIQQLKLDQIESVTGHAFLPFVVRMDKNSPQGFIRDWVLPGSGAEKNYGYAFQWFAMAATLLIVYFAVNIKKVPNDKR